MVHICQYLAAVDKGQPDKVLTICQGRQQTAQAVAWRVSAFASALQLQAKLQCGDVVMLAAKSTDYFLESLLAVSSLGCIVAPINLRWNAQEAASAINLCQPSILLVDTVHRHFLALLSDPECKCLKRAVVVGWDRQITDDSKLLYAETMIQQHRGAPLQTQHAPNDAALICFTSGTTGQPKAALISHTALHHQSQAKLRVVGYNAQDCYLHAAPLFHIGGLSSAMAVLLAGGKHVFMERFSPKPALDAIQQHRITAIIAVPAMISDLAREATAGAQQSACPSMERVLVGAGGLSQALQRQLQALFPNAACYSAYGMTEACSSMTFRTLHLPGSGVAQHGHRALEGPAEDGVCVGTPPPGIEMAVLKSDSQASPCMSAISSIGYGEVLTRGSHVFSQYWGQPAATQQAMLPGSWLRTGDMGTIDQQGQVWLKGRLKDIIRTGGETVHPSEVETVLLQHPSIAAAAVFGMPHGRLGEQVAAVIVLDRAAWDGLTLTSKSVLPTSSLPVLTSIDVIQHCRKRLSAFKLPRIIAAQHTPLLLNASGKIIKPLLSQQLHTAMQKRQVGGASATVSRL